MKLFALITIGLLYSVFKFVLLVESNVFEPELPEFQSPDLAFNDLSGGCSGIVDCTKYVGDVLYDIALSVVFLVRVIFESIQFGFGLVKLALVLHFAGFEGMPSWLNVTITGLLTIATLIAGFNFIRGRQVE